MKVRRRPLLAGIVLLALAIGAWQYRVMIQEATIVGGPGPELTESTPAP